MATICGYLDGLHNGLVFGWALDADAPQTPVVVQVVVNDEWSTESGAIHLRPDVAQHFGNAGLCGFWVRLPAAFAGQTCKIAVLVNGSPLPNSPLTVSVPEPLPLPGRVVFMHIQKTAGTAFREAIVANYSYADTLLIYPDPPGITVRNARLLPEAQRFGVRLVMGHFRFGVHEFLGDPAPYITLLRHPADQVISHYQHIRRHGKPEVFDGDRPMPLEEVLEKHAAMDLDNHMTRLVLGYRWKHLGIGQLRDEHFQQAIRNLHEHFEYIGLQEHAEEAWAEMQRRFGWSAGALHRRNVGGYDASAVPPAARRAAVRANPWDMALYEYALSRRRV